MSVLEMEIDRLRYFSVIARTESIRKAAEILRVSPSALSKAVSLLEAELATQLIQPNGRGISLTREGKKLAEEADGILKRVAEVKERIQEEKTRTEESPLRIGTFEVFSTYFLSVLDEVKWEKRPLVLHELLPGEVERAVSDGGVDVGITYMPIAYPGVEHIKITSIEMGVFRKRGVFETTSQEKLPFVVPAIPLHAAPTRIRGLDGWPDDAYERLVRFEVTLMESALELCRQGRCAGYFPVFVVEEHNRKYRAEFQLQRHPSPFGGRVCRSDVFLVRSKDRAEDRMLKNVAKMVRLGTQVTQKK